VFYRGIRESALFYTHRRAQSLKTAEQLKDYLASDQRVYAITTRKRLARLPFRPYVVERQGDKLLISNKKSPWSKNFRVITEGNNGMVEK